MAIKMDPTSESKVALLRCLAVASLSLCFSFAPLPYMLESKMESKMGSTMESQVGIQSARDVCIPKSEAESGIPNGIHNGFSIALLAYMLETKMESNMGSTMESQVGVQSARDVCIPKLEAESGIQNGILKRTLTLNSESASNMESRA